MFACVVFFQAEDGIRDLVRSRGLGDVYKRQVLGHGRTMVPNRFLVELSPSDFTRFDEYSDSITCLLYTSDAADERSSVDLGGRRIIKKKKKINQLLYTRRTILNTLKC